MSDNKDPIEDLPEDAPEDAPEDKTEDKTEGDPARKRTTCTVMVFKKRKFTKRRPKN